MNMKKTMAAIAAGTVAVSAMATTVSAEDTNLWPTRTLSFNLVEDVHEITGWKVILTASLEHVDLTADGANALEIEVTGLGEANGLSKNDVVTVKGYYDGDNTPIRDMYFTRDQGNALYSPAGAASMSLATSDTLATGKVVIPITATNNVSATAYVLDNTKTSANIYVTIEKYLEGNSAIKKIEEMRSALNTGAFDVTMTIDATTDVVWTSKPTGVLAGTKALPVLADGWEEKTNDSHNAYFTNSATTADALDHVYYTNNDTREVTLSNGNAAKVTKQVEHAVVVSAINDGLVNFGNATFTFKTWTGKDDYKAFGKNWWEVEDGQIGNLFSDTTNYWINNWEDMTLFGSALIVNRNITMSLSGTSAMKWTKDALSFDWDDIQASALNPNYFTNYINNMVLRTGKDWYWEQLDITFLENTAEDVSMGAGDDANDGEIPDDDETDIDLGDDEGDDEGDDWDDEGDDEGDDWDDEGDEDEGDEDEGDVDNDQDVNSPKTGNPAVALAVIPVALAAAAVVAKKRG